MNKEAFSIYVLDPGLLNDRSLPEFTELVKEFPYCQTARILLTLNLFKEKHVLYDTQLKLTAVQAGNRRVLKKHIDALSKTAEKVVLPDEDIEGETAVEEKEIAGPGTETKEQVPVEEEKPEVAVEEALTEEKDISEEITEPAVDSEQGAEKITESPPPQKEPLPEKTQKPEDFLQPTERGTSHADLMRIVAERLRYLEKEKRTTFPPTAREEEKSKKVIQPVRPQSELIDEFIKNEPRIARPQHPFFNPEDAAKESVVDDENIVSETLARIYFDQKRFEKAISIYKKLSLKFPEKSSYFAALIQKAEEELKN
ncbi:MAG: hypothetical protein GXO86_02495 [Chlorobi bacterium]|nr:hypothetical protein [Chlorobiota bacterium]